MTNPEQAPDALFAGWEKGRSPDGECVAICENNARESAAAEDRARRWYETSQPGSNACREARYQIAVHVAERKHWAEMAEWYRTRPRKEMNP